MPLLPITAHFSYTWAFRMVSFLGRIWTRRLSSSPLDRTRWPLSASFSFPGRKTLSLSLFFIRSWCRTMSPAKSRDLPFFRFLPLGKGRSRSHLSPSYSTAQPQVPSARHLPWIPQSPWDPQLDPPDALAAEWPKSAPL